MSSLNGPVREMTAVEAAWIGAMLEAEGAIVRCHPASRRPYWRLDIGNTDVEIIATLLRLVGAGTVNYTSVASAASYPSNVIRRTKDRWTWFLSGREQLRSLAPQIIPYMTQKGDRLAAAVAD